MLSQIFFPQKRNTLSRSIMAKNSPNNRDAAGNAKRVKSYYIYEERYDWLKDPRRFEKIYHTFRSRVFLKEILKILGNSSSSLILDAGCGTGLITIHLPRPIICVDINPWNLEKLKSRLEDKELIQADLEYIPFRDNCLDLIVCTEVIEHLPSPRNTIREFHRTLKKSGKLIGTVPSIHPIWRFRKFFLTTCPVTEPFHKNYMKDELEEMIKIFALNPLFVGGFLYLYY
jgi:ubiquinone/menaquinone biosynthesis C-methylase UbiE